jgi:peptidoglycan glycosyltransferase
VNKPLRRVALFCLLLMAALMINANLVQVVRAKSISNHPGNQRQLLAEYAHPRGPILVDGKPIAQSSPDPGAQLKYLRNYPQGPEYAQITGYDSIFYGRTGLEAYENSVLSGSDNRLFVSRLKELFTGKQQQGGAVLTTINAAAQQAAYNGLKQNGGIGAVVAIQPSTGAILALASSPTYDPNPFASHYSNVASQYANQLTKNVIDPRLDLAIQENYPPGSVFKIVTAAAALESGQYNENDPVPGASPSNFTPPNASQPLDNENHETCPGTSLKVALENSCNTVYGYLGLKIGASALQSEAEKFGLNSFGGQQGQLGIPMSVANSVFPRDVGKPGNEPLLAQSAIGQYNVAVTPLQAAMIAATVANKGVVMQPYLVAKELAPDGSVLSSTQPKQLSVAMSPANAAIISDMMVGVVTNGTGSNAQIPGVQVAGKTGTAQRATNQKPLAWFVAFAPANNPQVAVAVLIQDDNAQRDEISGGGLAAPIAKQVMQAVLQP